jgi:hypothetical protein
MQHINIQDFISLIYDFISTYEELSTYEGKIVVFKKNLDLQDIDESFEKGLPQAPIITVFMSKILFNPNKYNAYKKQVPNIVIDCVVPDPDRETAYIKSLDFATKISEVIDFQYQFIPGKKYKTFLTDSINRIGGRKFGEKGVYAPHRIEFLIEV